MKRAVLSVCILALALILTACGPAPSDSAVSTGDSASGDHAFDYGGDVTLRILSGSENQELEGILDDFARERGVNIEMDYQGSLDIMRTLQGETIEYDAVWPASSLWLTAGDTQYRVKHAQSISGCSAYIGFLYALLDNPDVITSESLQAPGLAEQITQLLSGVDRSSGSSDWLKELFLTGGYDAMVNYECLVISANQELEDRGEETLYAVYPYDGLSIADSPLGYVDNGDAGKEQAFLDLQEYLLSDEVQNEIQRTGRRTGYEGVSAENADVFRADWGIQPDRVLSPIRMPSTDVLMECLNLYQTQFRKPSLTVYCLDYSGSMGGTGREQMVEAMSQILIQENAEKNLLQASEHEVNILIPFEGYPRDIYTAVGNGSELESLYTQVEAEVATGGTDIYAAATEGLQQLGNYDLSQYTPAIILLTDGVSDGSIDAFQTAYEAFGADVPVFSIMFGSADPTQLEELAELTHARVFDGREDLIGAFRSVKGYN